MTRRGVPTGGASIGSLAPQLSDIRPLDDRHADRPVSTAVWRDPVTDEHHEVVVKRFTGPDAVERASTLHRIGCALWTSSAGATRPTPAVPRPIATGPLDGGAAVVMEALGGAAIGARGDLGRSIELASDAADLFADLHTAVPTGADVHPWWPAVPRRPADRIVRSSMRKHAELAALEVEDPCGGAAEFAAAAAGLVSRLQTWSTDIGRDEETLVVTHGDAAPRNVLATPAGLRLIDLDRVHLASPSRDVAYWLAWSSATAWTGRPGQQPTDDFLVHYVVRRIAIDRMHGRERPDGLDAYCPDLAFHLAAAFVRIAHGWSVLRTDPGARRDVLERATSLVDETPERCDLAWRRALDVDRRCGGPGAGENMRACGDPDNHAPVTGRRERTGR